MYGKDIHLHPEMGIGWHTFEQRKNVGSLDVCEFVKCPMMTWSEMIGFPRRLRDHKLILSQVHLIIVQGANFLHLADASCFDFLKYELIISCRSWDYQFQLVNGLVTEMRSPFVYVLSSSSFYWQGRQQRMWNVAMWRLSFCSHSLWGLILIEGRIM